MFNLNALVHAFHPQSAGRLALVTIIVLSAAALRDSSVAPSGTPMSPFHVSAAVVDRAEVALFGYSPQRVRSHLGLREGEDGRGMTIAIVVAFHNSNVVEEVNAFSERFALPRVCDRDEREDCFTLRQISLSPLPQYDRVWARETALDVQWAHAIAPRASIVLVEAVDNELPSLLAAIDVAARQPGVVAITNSWGGARGHYDVDSHCALATAVCVFASGNEGIAGDIVTPAPTVAQATHALSVGGTTLVLDTAGRVVSERAWVRSTGGMHQPSTIPPYQSALDGIVGRATPDVAFNADPGTGFAVYSIGKDGRGQWRVEGGTSAGAPQWAALIAIANQYRVTPLSGLTFEPQVALYTAAARGVIFDVVDGRNGLCGDCIARPGYDFATGLGSPRPGIVEVLAGGFANEASAY